MDLFAYNVSIQRQPSQFQATTKILFFVNEYNLQMFYNLLFQI